MNSSKKKIRFITSSKDLRKAHVTLTYNIRLKYRNLLCKIKYWFIQPTSFRSMVRNSMIDFENTMSTIVKNTINTYSSKDLINNPDTLKQICDESSQEFENTYLKNNGAFENVNNEMVNNGIKIIIENIQIEKIKFN